MHAVLPDRIETGTYAMAAAICGGEVELTGTSADLIGALMPLLEAAGTTMTPHQLGDGGTCATVARRSPPMSAPSAYPGFPTDLQAQFMALMTTAEGTSHIKETIFENRFMHVPELLRMGADIQVQGDMAMVRGVEQLNGAPVMATDLRASSSLVLAGLAAEGETMVNRVYHLDRGFERLEEKLSRRRRGDRAVEGMNALRLTLRPRMPTISRSSPRALQDAVAQVKDLDMAAEGAALRGPVQPLQMGRSRQRAVMPAGARRPLHSSSVLSAKSHNIRRGDPRRRCCRCWRSASIRRAPTMPAGSSSWCSAAAAPSGSKWNASRRRSPM